MTDSFDLNQGGGSTSFSFGPQGSQPGAFIDGIVVDLKEVQETNYETKKPEFWENGDPKMQLRLTLQTELRDPANTADDGKRDVYLDGYKKPHPANGTSSRLWAVLEAVRIATGGTSIQRGGRVVLQWVSGMGFTGDPRHYIAQYAPPALDLNAQPEQPASAPQVAPQVQAAPVVQQQVPAAVAPIAAPQIQAPVAAPVVTQAPVVQAAPAAAPAQAGPTPEQVAAVRAAGQDPAVVWPGFTG